MMNNTKSSMNDIKPKDPIELDIVELNTPEINSEENVLPEHGLYRYLY